MVNCEGDILVVSQRGTSWSLPKGHIDEGEDARTAAIREIEEESGISELSYIQELGTYQRYKIGLDGQDDLSELKTLHMFLFRTNQMALAPQDAENPEARWVSKEEVAGLLTHRKDKEFFNEVMCTLNPAP